MSVRIYLNPSLFPFQPNPSSSQFILVDGIKQPVFEGGGLIYFHTRLMAPMSPGLRKGIVAVTYVETVHDMEQIQKITRGRYVHGEFQATVSEGVCDGRRVLEISAMAPSMNLLNRWLQPLLTGEDSPRHVYGKPAQPLVATAK